MSYHHSKIALHDLTSRPSILAIKRLPSVDSAHLHTDHVLVSVLWREVAHAGCFGLPWVPNHGILQVLPDHVERWLSVDLDRGGVLLDRLVDAVYLSSEADLIALRTVLRCIEHLVDVLCACETGDCGLGDILMYVSSTCYDTTTEVLLTGMRKYVCVSIWKSNGLSPAFCTFSCVCSPSLPNVTLYCRLNSYGQAFFISSLRLAAVRPKSSLTASSPPFDRRPDSEDDLPRYSHFEMRAKPCCGRLEVAWFFGGGPKF